MTYIQTFRIVKTLFDGNHASHFGSKQKQSFYPRDATYARPMVSINGTGSPLGEARLEPGSWLTVPKIKTSRTRSREGPDVKGNRRRKEKAITRDVPQYPL
jgi:hypothetical protein